MIIFARKHFSKKNARMFSFLINMAVYMRALVAVIMRFIRKAFLPVSDFAMIFAGIYFIKNYWELNVLYQHGGVYPIEFIAVAVPIYIGNSETKAVHLFSCRFAGDISAENRVGYYVMYEALADNYKPCKQCLNSYNKL